MPDRKDKEVYDTEVRDLLSNYFREINKKELLSAREEVYLSRRARRGNEKARLAMIEANLKLVVFVAKRFINKIYGLQFEDVIQEGNFGLFDAVDKFDWRKGCRFSTFATYWIYQRIQRAVMSQNEVVRVPVHVYEKISKYNQVARSLTQQLGGEPPLEEVAKAMRVTVATVTAVHIASMRAFLLDVPVGEKEDTALDFIVEEDGFSEEKSDIDKLRFCLEKNIKKLSEKEQIVVRKRFGLDGEDPYTLDKIGSLLEMTRERVRQIESRALKKLARKSNLQIFRKDFNIKNNIKEKTASL